MLFLNPHAGIKMVSSQSEYGSKYELSEFLINQLFSSNERSFKWKYSEPFPMRGNKILTKNLARQNSSINYFAILLLQKDLWKPEENVFHTNMYNSSIDEHLR